VPWKLITDQGREFTAKTVQKYFSSIDLQHFSIFTSPQFHAGMAERANRSIKERLYRLFTERQTQRWIDVVQDIVKAINNSPNSSIGGMRPVDVTYENAEKLRSSLKEKAEETFGQRRWREQRFHVGDVVRIEKHKHIFQKGYLPNFTSELFIVDRIRLVPSQPPTYKIRDMNGEIIQGWFYANDLCRFQQRKEKDKLYKIEKIIKKQKRNGAEYVYIKWRGYGPTYNSWIPASTVETI
jgi:L-rhamnose mutarotase